MKFCYFLLLFILPLSVFAAPFWQLKSHSLDSQIIQREMAKMWQSGYVPLGMEIYENQLVLLYVQMKDIAADYFLEVLDVRTLGQNGIAEALTRRMNMSYLPQALCLNQDLLYVIYLKTEWEISQWELLSLPPGYTQQEEMINAKSREGYLPMAVTETGGQRFLLCVQLYGLQPKEWLLKSVSPDPESLRSQIESSVAKNWIPWGILLSPEEHVVLFLKF